MESWTQIVMLGIAAVCIFAVLTVAVRERRRTGSWPTLWDRGPFRSQWFSSIVIWDIMLRVYVLQGLRSTIPGAIVFSAVDTTLFLAMATVAGKTLTAYLNSQWNWQVALRQSHLIIYTFALGFLVFLDVHRYLSMAWIWTVALVATGLLLPVLTRAAYLEYCQQRTEVPQPLAQPRPEIWQP